jgi:hypothetical protein
MVEERLTFHFEAPLPMKIRLSVMMAVLSLTVACGPKAMPDVDLSAEQPRVVLFTEQHDPAEVRAAIVKAMQARGWNAESDDESGIVARLSHKGATIRVKMQYAPDRVTTTGLQADGAGKGYAKWVGNLESSIRDALKAPPAPAAVTPPKPTLAVFESQQNPSQVKVALQRALTQHSWVIEQEEAGGSLIARLNHRKGLVRVRITADATQATITYVESQELDIDPNGRSAEYEKWMRNLVDSIRTNTR